MRRCAPQELCSNSTFWVCLDDEDLIAHHEDCSGNDRAANPARVAPMGELLRRV
jgi:hypothetical protein